MVSEVGGETLARRLERRTLGLAELAPIVDDVLNALVDRHSDKSIHRSITPHVLFIEPSGVRGRTWLLEPEPRPPDAFDATLEAFPYMAPEQVRGSSTVDSRTDLYALGVVVFRALTGKLPFDGSSTLVLIAQKFERDPPTLHEASGATWPPALERFVATMMARDRGQRFRSAAVALEAWRQMTLS
jgi:serine/threonine-protein kinase